MAQHEEINEKKHINQNDYMTPVAITASCSPPLHHWVSVKHCGGPRCVVIVPSLPWILLLR